MLAAESNNHCARFLNKLIFGISVEHGCATPARLLVRWPSPPREPTNITGRATSPERGGSFPRSAPR